MRGGDKATWKRAFIEIESWLYTSFVHRFHFQPIQPSENVSISRGNAIILEQIRIRAACTRGATSYNFESRDDCDDENERAMLVSLLNSSILVDFLFKRSIERPPLSATHFSGLRDSGEGFAWMSIRD